MNFFKEGMDCFPFRFARGRNDVEYRSSLRGALLRSNPKKPMNLSHAWVFYTLLFTLMIMPVYGQSFETLLNELSGSEADQLESESADTKKKETQPSSTDITSLPEEDEFTPEKNIVTSGVTLQGLDKQSAHVFIIDAPIGKPVEFGTLKIIVHRCEKAPLEDRQESMAFLTISEQKPQSEAKTFFSGWMFASSPSLSYLDHPVYDVWVKECKGLE